MYIYLLLMNIYHWLIICTSYWLPILWMCMSIKHALLFWCFDILGLADLWLLLPELLPTETIIKVPVHIFPFLPLPHDLPFCLHGTVNKIFFLRDSHFHVFISYHTWLQILGLLKSVWMCVYSVNNIIKSIKFQV